MDNIAKAVQILLGLTTLATNTGAAIAAVVTAISAAQKEGRDLGDDEVANLRAKSDNAHLLVQSK